MGKYSRNNKIYEKQVASVIENCKRKSNYAKRKFKTFRTQSLLNYGSSVDLPFRLELYQNSYMCLNTGSRCGFTFIWCSELKSDRQFVRLVRTCAIRLTVVLMNCKLEPTIWPRDTGHIGVHGRVDARTVVR